MHSLILRDAALFTDLYELTMAASYLRERMEGEATFSLFVRRLPPRRSFLVAAGLDDVLAYLEGYRFSEAAIRHLRGLGSFETSVLDRLAELRFTGSVRAMPEGTVVFADEPILEVTAPIVEAQLVETAVINFVHPRPCSRARPFAACSRPTAAPSSTSVCAARTGSTRGWRRHGARSSPARP
jgi:nicotinate phosphoribosyltransferase